MFAWYRFIQNGKRQFCVIPLLIFLIKVFLKFQIIFKQNPNFFYGFKKIYCNFPNNVLKVIGLKNYV